MMSESEKNKVKILVCCHKAGEWLNDDIYLPIQCGKAISDLDLGIQGDDTGDNISVKNKNYCELTAIYWAWKNLRDVDYVGLVHYRRYFMLKGHICYPREVFYVNDISFISDFLLEKNELIKLLKKSDVILPIKKTLSLSLKRNYCSNHISEDFSILRDVLKEKSPEYLSSFDQVMNKRNSASFYNMFIFPFSIFDDYCTWLFNLLFEVERRISISFYPYQARVLGFMGERLLNVYCFHHNLRITYKPILFIGSSDPYGYFMYLMNRLRNNISFLISS